MNGDGMSMGKPQRQTPPLKPAPKTGPLLAAGVEHPPSPSHPANAPHTETDRLTLAHADLLAERQLEDPIDAALPSHKRTAGSADLLAVLRHKKSAHTPHHAGRHGHHGHPAAARKRRVHSLKASRHHHGGVQGGLPRPNSPSTANTGHFNALSATLETLGVTRTFLQHLSETYHVPVSLIMGVIQQESGGRANARSNVGAAGLMQLMPGTARELGVHNPMDPKQNVEGGAKYLGRLLNQFGGDTSRALAAYNAGPGAVERYHGVPPYKETRHYVATIMASQPNASLNA